MATNKSNTKNKLLVGAGIAALAGGIAAAIALSDEKNREKVKEISKKLKAKSKDVFSELKKLANKTHGKPSEDKSAKKVVKKG